MKKTAAALALSALAVSSAAVAATSEEALVDTWWKHCVKPGMAAAATTIAFAQSDGAKPRQQPDAPTKTHFTIAVPGVADVALEVGEADCAIAARGLAAGRADSILKAFDQRLQRVRFADMRWSDRTDPEYRYGTREGELRWPGEARAMELMALVVPQADGDKMVLESRFPRAPAGMRAVPVPSLPAGRWQVFGGAGSAVAWDEMSLGFGPDSSSRQLDFAAYTATERAVGERSRYRAAVSTIVFDCFQPRIAVRATRYYDGAGQLVADTVPATDLVWVGSEGDPNFTALQQVACHRGELENTTLVRGDATAAIAAMRAAAEAP